jgi:hypothetical protein
MHWMLGQEDVILRGASREKETDIVIRGHSDGTLTVREPNPEKKLPLFRVVRAKQRRAELLKEMGM